MHELPLLVSLHGYGDGFHRTVTSGQAIAGLVIDVATPQTAWTVVAVLAARDLSRYAQPTVTTFKGLVARHVPRLRTALLVHWKSPVYSRGTVVRTVFLSHVWGSRLWISAIIFCPFNSRANARSGPALLKKRKAAAARVTPVASDGHSSGVPYRAARCDGLETML